MPESPIRALPAACQQKGREGYRRWTRSTRLRALHTALTKYAALARPLGRSGAPDCRADVNANIPQYRCVFLRRRGIPDRPKLRLTKRREEHQGKRDTSESFRPPDGKGAQCESIPTRPLVARPGKLESPVYHRGAFLSSFQSRFMSSDPEHAVFGCNQQRFTTVN